MNKPTMMVDEELPFDLNVRIVVLNENEQVVRDNLYKNTATQRMTKSIAAFLAGHDSSYKTGSGRPNFVSFGTTGIEEQPKSYGGTAVVSKSFSQTHFDRDTENNRTRPWFTSQSIADHKDGFWNPKYGWMVPDPTSPGKKRWFQGELCTSEQAFGLDKFKIEQGEKWDSNFKTITRPQLLRGDIRDSMMPDHDGHSYGSETILYAYASVLWCKQFFEPDNGPSLNKIAISEVGLYEGDVTSGEGVYSLMAGFRVPTPADIIYIEPGWVILVEWRVVVRALMPCENVTEKN